MESKVIPPIYGSVPGRRPPIRKKHGPILLLCPVLLGLYLAPPLSGQATYPAGSRGPHPSGHANPGPPEASGGNAYQNWVSAKWTGDERPYLKIKADLDAALAHGTPAPALVARCEGPARANLLDAKAQFAWAYATQLQVQTGQGIAQPPPLYGLRRLGAPDCYPVARLRFLLTQEMEPNDNHLYLRPVAERLLKRDPNDRLVRRALIRALCSRPAGLPEALKLAQEDVERTPTKPGVHAALAAVYNDMDDFSHGHNAVFRQKSIQEYEAFLKYAKPDDSYRPSAIQMLQALKTEKPW